MPTSGGWGVVFEAVDELPRHPVQLYEAVAYLIICLILLAVYRRFGQRTPHGLLFGGFMVLVFSVRIAVEFYKVPQAAYESGQMFSVGQYLSLPFVVLGAAMVLRSTGHLTRRSTGRAKAARRRYAVRNTKKTQGTQRKTTKKT